MRTNKTGRKGLGILSLNFFLLIAGLMTCGEVTPPEIERSDKLSKNSAIQDEEQTKKK